MATDYTSESASVHAANVFRTKWLWLVLLGGVLMVAGIVAMLVPAISEIAASKVLGSVLIVSGIVQIMQSAKMLMDGNIWHLLLGILAAVGGTLIYLDPFAGVIAITILIAIIFAVHGVTQVAFAVKVRRHSWLALVPGVGLHRPGGERAAHPEASLSPLLHACDDCRRFPVLRGPTSRWRLLRARRGPRLSSARANRRSHKRLG